MISPTLLEVQRDGTTLSLRVDDLTLEESELTSDTITLWILADCDDVERAFALFTESLAQPVYIDVFPNATTQTVAVWVNYAADEETFTCASVHQTSVQPSLRDIQQRVVRLAELYQQRDQEYNTLYQRTTQATRRFSVHIEKAKDRCERKFDFFHNSRPDKAAIYSTQRDTYAHVLHFLHVMLDDAYRDESDEGKNDSLTGAV